MTNLTPVPKVTAALLGGAVSTVVLFVISAVWNVEFPVGVEGAAAAIGAFAAGWLVPDHGPRGDAGQASTGGLIGLVLVLVFVLIIVLLLIGRI